MYAIVLILHSLIRWLALILGIAAAGFAWFGWLKKQDWKPLNRKLGAYFTIAMDLQLALGLLLYLAFSPITRAALQNFSAAMSAPRAAFFCARTPIVDDLSPHIRSSGEYTAQTPKRAVRQIPPRGGLFYAGGAVDPARDALDAPITPARGLASLAPGLPQ
ncbi:MAG: hypothetical protein M5U05_01870 [Anaerolineales bacterium]|nr:hypothetical protein [Anaerolineales bacterium]